MKPAIIIHLKAVSTRLKKKNFRKILNKPLYKITFDKLKKYKTYFDIFIDSSSDTFKIEADRYGYNFIKRPKRLDKSNAQGNELLIQCLQKIDNEIIFQLLVTNPFLKVSTIKKCVNILKAKKSINSVTTVSDIYDRYWFKKKEINHKYNNLIGSQFLDPVQVEAGTYCFRKSIFLKEKSRILKQNLFLKIDDIQAVDIDNEIDFLNAENIAKKYKKLII